MARTSTRLGRAGPNQAAALKLAQLAPLTPQGVNLSRRSLAVGGSTMVLPAAHPSIPTPLVRSR